MLGLAAAVAACLIAAPAVTDAAEPLANPIAEPGRLWAFEGFALKPPGAEWSSLVRERERVVFTRRTGGPTYAMVATARAARVDAPPQTPEALAELVRRREPRSPDALRFEIKARAVELEPAASWCVRHRLLAEDSRESFFYPRILRLAERVCAHPGSPGLLIEASYLEHAIEGASRAAALDEGEAFLAGIRLTPLHPPAFADAETSLVNGAAVEAVRMLLPLAEAGDSRAAHLLGVAYEQGSGVPRDRAAADRWYRVAAEAGEVDALYNLGALHESPARGKRDAAEALRWFRRAADQRDAQAQLNIALLYLKGDGVAADPGEARYWLRLAADNGSARARALLRQLFP